MARYRYPCTGPVETEGFEHFVAGELGPARALATWSFSHPHHLSSFGGGAVVCPDASWLRVVESVTHWGRECTCHYEPGACTAPPGIHHHLEALRPWRRRCEGAWPLSIETTPRVAATDGERLAVLKAGGVARVNRRAQRGLWSTRGRWAGCARRAGCTRWR